MNKETQQNILSEIEARAHREIIAKNPTPLSDPHTQLLMRVAKMSEQIGKAYVAEITQRKMRPDLREATHEISNLYQDVFKDLNKDEIFFLCVWLHACMSAQGLRDNGVI